MKRYIKLLACIMGIIIFGGIGSLSIFSLQVEATSETELLRIAISHLKDEVPELEEEIEVLKNNPAADGVGISTIEQTASEGNENIYTITLTDGSSYDFIVQNGLDGKDGRNTVSQVVSNGETSSAAGTIAMIIASISMLGTVIMGICLVKSGNFKSKNVSERGF